MKHSKDPNLFTDATIIGGLYFGVTLINSENFVETTKLIKLVAVVDEEKIFTFTTEEGKHLDQDMIVDMLEKTMTEVDFKEAMEVDLPKEAYIEDLKEIVEKFPVSAN